MINETPLRCILCGFCVCTQNPVVNQINGQFMRGLLHENSSNQKAIEHDYQFIGCVLLDIDCRQFGLSYFHSW